MKTITLFVLATCPHCVRALEMMERLYAHNPEYQKIPLTIIDEAEQAELANQYDYYYVPTFYVDEEKMHEGVPSPEAIARVFAQASKA